MGLVIFAGLGLGTVFTLFVVPAVYVLIAKDRNAESVAGATLKHEVVQQGH